MRVICLDCIQVDLIIRFLQIFNEIRYLSNIQHHQVFIKTNFERFLEWVIFRVATFWKFKLLDNFNFELKILEILVDWFHVSGPLIIIIKMNTNLSFIFVILVITVGVNLVCFMGVRYGRAIVNLVENFPLLRLFYQLCYIFLAGPILCLQIGLWPFTGIIT